MGPSSLKLALPGCHQTRLTVEPPVLLPGASQIPPHRRHMQSRPGFSSSISWARSTAPDVAVRKQIRPWPQGPPARLSNLAQLELGRQRGTALPCMSDEPWPQGSRLAVLAKSHKLLSHCLLVRRYAGYPISLSRGPTQDRQRRNVLLRNTALLRRGSDKLLPMGISMLYLCSNQCTQRH